MPSPRVTFDDTPLATPSTVSLRATAGGVALPDFPGVRVGPYAVEQTWGVKVTAARYLELSASAVHVTGSGHAVCVLLQGRIMLSTGRVTQALLMYDTPPHASAAAARAMAAVAQILDPASEVWRRLTAAINAHASLARKMGGARMAKNRLIRELRQRVRAAGQQQQQH